MLEIIDLHYFAGTTPLDSVIEDLKTRRKKHERIRVELEKYSKALHKVRFEGKVEQFAFACYHLLETEPTAISVRMMRTPLTSLLDDLDEYRDHAVPRTSLVELAI